MDKYRSTIESQPAANGHLRVLIVDDEVELTEALTDVLELNDINVSVANSGEEALDRLRADTFDCILMDIMMPGMNGVETMKQARELAPGVIIMLMTAYSVDELIDEAKRAGALSVLKKPINIDSFISFLNRFKTHSSVLIVDEDAHECRMLQEALVPRGYRTFIASDPAEALAAASANQYEVVLMNQEGKNGDGVETVVAIRDLDPKAVFVLLDSCANIEHIVNSGVERESLVAISKPFNINGVVTLFDQVRFRKLRQALREQRIQEN
jgi:DNA-binding NtrC family response regulator